MRGLTPALRSRSKTGSTSSSRLAQLATHLTHQHITTATTATTHPPARHRAMSTFPSSPAEGEAPWRSPFLEHVQGMASPEFTLGTVRRVRSSSDGSADTAAVPRARTCIFRGMFADLPANPRNPAPRNPAGVYAASDLITFTTDVRSDKMRELFGLVADDDDGEVTGKQGEGEGKGGEEGAAIRGSGGGAPVEATFWARQAATQWRVRGRAWVLAPDIEDAYQGSEGARRAVEALKARMRRIGEGEWSFAREITAHFGNLSALMRGSFRGPPPGRPVDDGDDGLRLGQELEDLHDEVARGNFRVVVIVPEQVDRADLSDPKRGRRWLYTFVGAGRREPRCPGGVVDGWWEKIEVWP
ncbi:hypothetical protein DL764_003299 [Monosporascus ibericus]|uniref:Pyridoxamine 5'-phosphate oxidase Alr4036 family FMN-binding domain-containing protein n=1 Tax=Monosporascus ibericus TaxID=155417 RepID=A0A4Q4TKD7_9PEZI|nr:hypothetical protein DL764_003299 [Monosporascus ibericus]